MTELGRSVESNILSVPYFLSLKWYSLICTLFVPLWKPSIAVSGTAGSVESVIRNGPLKRQLEATTWAHRKDGPEMHCVCVCVCVYDFLERSSFIDKGSQIGEVSYNKFSFLVPNVVYKMRVCRCADLTTLNTTKAIMLCGCVDEIASQIVLTFFSVVSAIFH